MSRTPKRLPGQSNADYDRPAHDANADFLGSQSLRAGGDPGWALRLMRAIGRLFSRRRG